MWIDLFINGKCAKSWLLADTESKAFDMATHNKREKLWREKTAQCEFEAADLICDCRQYQFYARVKASPSCRKISEEVVAAVEEVKEAVVSVPLYEQWQVQFIAKYAESMTVDELHEATGLNTWWIYNYFRRNKIQFKKAYNYSK